MTPMMLLNSHVTYSYIFYAYVLFLSIWGFEIFEFFFFFLGEIYGLGFVNLILYDHALHPYCIIIMFHAYLDVCN